MMTSEKAHVNKHDSTEDINETYKSVFTEDSIYGDTDLLESEQRIIYLSDIIDDIKTYVQVNILSLRFLYRILDDYQLVGSHLKSVSKLFRKETGNFWDYSAAIILFVAIQVYLFRTPSSKYLWDDKIVFPAIYFGALLCLMMSWLFLSQTRNSQYRDFNSFIKVDYLGIAILAILSYIPCIYYTLNCNSCYKIVYLGFVLLTTGATWLALTKDTLLSVQNRWIRMGLFTALILCVGIPLLHFVIMKKSFWLVVYCSGGWMLLLATLYVTAVIVYVGRPWGVFSSASSDLFFLSHQVLHVFVFAAAFVHLHGIK